MRKGNKKGRRGNKKKEKETEAFESEVVSTLVVINAEYNKEPNKAESRKRCGTRKI
ncbi:predicted protein [Histoplasma mississippiense (nom. inval.)]|uniref:predicted protein n=1 Tax=Ajellomyces capsulatus (strain NAm1 / WU24) TaxID=2059318 RepID=UPI000157C0BC|nr:predicted protein [Histoplasma mississippiense (nom. inval.)]EDN06436.1 predicted protein [Histoplasma mississippiense (nom. inval.)]